MTTSKKTIYLFILFLIFLFLAFMVYVKISGSGAAVDKSDEKIINEQNQQETKFNEAANLIQPSFTPLTEDQKGGQENMLEVASQQINGRTIFVSKVITTDDSWLAIYSDNAGQPGNLLGYQAVGAGIAHNLVIELSPLPENTALLAVLHSNLGARERFEYPNGPDVIIVKNGQPLIAPFSLIQEDR